ncbi:cohesin subunit SA-1 [Phlebotomus argentipes]|uniref:cohesin subunit SA-1 n=1 Tax=Phlebotomus argentipes TaxID=94469 RepID=UPI0028937408|nr:cohesin subunit SA-1 [Phlebotomus argentipes]
MHRRGGKRIRMMEASFNEQMAERAESESDHGDSEASPNKSGRMTRLRARGGVRDKPPIIDDDIDDLIAPPVVKKRKQYTKQPKRAPAEPRERVEREPRERVATATEKETRDVTTDESSLYYIVRHSKSSIATIVDDWISKYKVDKETALIDLMQFFINASGCKGKIDHQLPAMDHTSTIRKMTEEFDEESGEYPLIMPGQQWKKFKQNFCDFVQTLVKQCQYSIIYDQFLMDNVISLLTGLSDSQVRAFRHTATLAAMKLMTALVDVALLVSVNFDNAARQYEAERLKTRDQRASDRLESLMAKRTELEENMDEIKNMLTYMFKSVFVHRYRDTLPDIRAICMIEIGVWMQKFSQNFLDDSYLKYIGWTLHDKVGEVRLRCLQALLPLYASEELKGKLELFTSKFKDRIVAMTLDKEFEVAVHAVRLVISILKIHPDILTDKDCEIVYELVYSSNRGVAQAAAEFLNVRLFRLDEEAINSTVTTKRGKVRLPNTPLIRDLVQFFIESELHEHGAYLVDSFIDSNPMVKDWECMTDLLLEDPGVTEEPLDNKQESTLIEIMVSSVRQSATGEPPVGRGSNRKMNLSAKEHKVVQDDKQKLTEHFIQALPKLLYHYSADAEKLTNLLAIPQFFDLDIYTTARQEGNLQALLDKMAHIMTIHTDRDVLETCSKTLEFLCMEGSAIYTKCDVARSTIIDQCVNRYKEAIDDWRTLIAGEEVPDEDEIYNVVSSLKKVSILFSCHNLNQWNLFDSLFRDIDELQTGEVGEATLPNEALIYCIEGCFFAINWALHSLENYCDTMMLTQQTEELRANIHKYLDACRGLINRGASEDIQEAAYISICDSLIIFSDQLSTHAQHLQRLEYEASLDMQSVLNDFVQQHVFALQQDEGQDERRISELHKKRNFLAGYCKLIVYNIIPTKAAADIFKHYLRCYNEYGDIIKSTLGKAREINKVNCAMTMCLSLVTMFKEIQARYNTPRISKSVQEFSDLRELAKRFTLSFGLDAVKNREAITALHRAGILFAVTQPTDMAEEPHTPPPCLLFLEIIMEFTNKLIKQDKRLVLSFLDRRIASEMPLHRGEDWQPLMNYRNSLLHGESDQPAAAPKRAYTRRRKDHEHPEDAEDENEDGADSDTEMRR